MVRVFSEENSLFNHYMAEMREVIVQDDRMRFRRNLERVGEIMAYELSKTMKYQEKTLETPLGESKVSLLNEQPVIAAILRAGLPLHQGVLNYFDKADNAFISAYRKHHKDGSFKIEVEYISCPDLNGRTVILCDPMLATGSSMVLAFKSILTRGKPSAIHIVSAIASQEGLNFAKNNLPAQTRYWIGAVDDELTAQAYIVPGLGDAGDLAYGNKI